MKLQIQVIGLLIILMTACHSTPPVKAPGPGQAENKPEIPPQAEQTEAGVLEDLYQRAIHSARSEKNEEAISLFSQITELDEGYRNASTNLGLLFLRGEKIDAAKTAFLQAIDRDKDNAIAYNHLAIIERRQGSFKQSREYYEKAIHAEPEYANAYLNFGILQDIYLQELPQAMENYKTYQTLTNNSDESVEKWILDIQRRIEADRKKTSEQPTS